MKQGDLVKIKPDDSRFGSDDYIIDDRYNLDTPLIIVSVTSAYKGFLKTLEISEKEHDLQNLGEFPDTLKVTVAYPNGKLLSYFDWELELI
tara:strand:+ start:4517 stop:4789 length:273 start_codon:yes stop_codon:yes gene_type:complete